MTGGPRVVRVEQRTARVQRVSVPGPVQVIRAGLTGPTGPPGAVGSIVTYSAVLAEAASVYSAVVSMADGLHVADPLNPAHGGRLNGVLVQSGAAGERVTVVLQGGISGWGGPFGRYWCGVNGQPNLIQPAGAWRQVVGFSPEAGLFVVQLKPVVLTPQ